MRRIMTVRGLTWDTIQNTPVDPAEKKLLLEVYENLSASMIYLMDILNAQEVKNAD